MFPAVFRKNAPGDFALDDIQAVLFDLDGTLIDVDMHRFVPGYLRRLTEQMGDRVDPERAVRSLHRAVAAMFANSDSGKTLETILLEVLQSELGLSAAAYLASLERFCRTELDALRPLVAGHPLAPQLVEVSLARGWRVVLATNPIFPRAVIDARLAWGALDGVTFDHVTAYETAHFCKPNPAFFGELLEMLGLPAEACLMIGNDTLHDLAASQVGMRTCLLTPWCIRRPGARFKADWQGDHAQLLTLLGCGAPQPLPRQVCPD